jgi:hypothetical protein
MFASNKNRTIKGNGKHRVLLAVFFLLSLVGSIFLTNIAPASTANAASCSASELARNKVTYQTTKGSGTILETTTGKETNVTPGGRQTTTYSCDDIPDGGRKVTYKIKENDSLEYFSEDSRGTISSGTSHTVCTDVLKLDKRLVDSDKGKTVKAKLQIKQIDGMGRAGKCTNDGDAKTVNVEVGGQATTCGSASYIYRGSTISRSANDCSSGTTTDIYSVDSSDPKLFKLRSGTDPRSGGPICGGNSNGDITLSKVPGDGDTTVNGSFQDLKARTGGRGQCENVGEPQRISVKVLSDDCSATGDLASICSQYADAKCAPQANLGEAAELSCRKSAVDAFKAAYAECSAANDQNRSGLLDCMKGRTPEVEAALEAAKSTEPDETTSCAIDGIGWIVCPVVNFLASIADASFDFLADSFLKTDPKVFNTSEPVYEAWSGIRNVANIVFVIIFIIIIFSQLTGLGVSNYGVKKMLPRLIIAAILMNISFFITQLMIDISNILGYSLKDFFNGLSVTDESNGATNAFATGEGFAGLAGSILAWSAGGVAIYALLSTFIPVLLAAVIALVIILFILVARQALIILLVVLAPLAFVAFLLPNTEKFFKQWRQMLTALLLVFPLIAIVYGASNLASRILSYSFTSSDDSVDTNWFGQIISAALLVLPLLAVPILLKKSLDGIPMLGQMANRWSGKANSRIGASAKDSYRGSLFGRGRAIRKQAKENFRAQKFARRITDRPDEKGFKRMDSILSGAVAGGLPPITKQGKAARQAVDRAALATADKANVEEVQAAAINLDRLKITQAEARVLASGGKVKGIDGKTDVAARSAAIQRVVSSNDVKGMNELWDASKSWSGSDGDKLRSTLARSLESSGARPAYYGAGALASLKLNEHKTAKETITSALQAGAYSPEKIAKADKDELHIVSEIAHSKSDKTSTDYDPTFLAIHQRLVNDAHKALTDPELSLSLGKNRDNVVHIRDNTTPPTPLP